MVLGDKMKYPHASRYTDLKKIYEECSGPGGLELAEYMAEKMGLKPDSRLLDIGTYRGYQTCFLTKEYGMNTVGIDPWDDRDLGIPHIDIVMKNAYRFDVADRLIALKSGVPDSLLPSNCFDYAYCTTTLEMVRGYCGYQTYLDSLREIKRVLRKDGVFGMAEPMHFPIDIPEDLRSAAQRNDWITCFATIDETVEAVEQAGFMVEDAGYCEDAERWWQEFEQFRPPYDNDPDDTFIIENNKGRWLTFGYVMARNL